MLFKCFLGPIRKEDRSESTNKRPSNEPGLLPSKMLIPTTQVHVTLCVRHVVIINIMDSNDNRPLEIVITNC